MKNKRKTGIFALGLALTLAACGGGSGGNSGVTTPLPPTPPVVVAPAPYTLTPATVEASYLAGSSVTVGLQAKKVVDFTGGAYVKAVADGDVITATVTQGGYSAPDSFLVQVQTSSTAKAGVYTGNLTISICTDANCAAQVAGSPIKVPYSIEVVTQDGAVQAFTEGPLAAMAGAADWGMFQANARHDGYVPITLNPAAFTARWELTPVAIGGQIAMSTIATGGGLLYVTNASSSSLGAGPVPVTASITAYSEADASKVWSRSFQDQSNPVTNPPAYANGRVYTSSHADQSRTMLALDATNGNQLFAASMGTPAGTKLAPTVFNDNVYANDGFGALYSYNASTGAVNFASSLIIDGLTPAFDSQNMYTYEAGGAGGLRIHDPATGAVRAMIAYPLNSSMTGLGTLGAAVVGGGGVVYGTANHSYTTGGDYIIAFDTVNKSVRWTAQGTFAGSPAYGDGYLFAANKYTGKLEVRRESDGGIEWSWAAPAADAVFYGDVLLTKNLVFVSTATTTYAIDRSTHGVVWSYKAGGNLALSANGVLYIKGTLNIVAINLK